MIIKSVRVQGLRSIYDETLPCDRLTALIGPNGVGKSSFLKAIEMFYTPGSRYTEEDFYAREAASPITVSVSFTQLTPDEKHLFAKYVQGEELTVQKEMTWPFSKTSQKYFGMSLQNADFNNFRRAANASERKAEYTRLRSLKQYSDLPDYTSQDEAVRSLKAWEESHTDKCTPKRDEGQFFGFKEVGEAHLERFTRFLFIPAVRDVSKDSVEAKGSVLSELMDIVVRAILSNRKDILALQISTQSKYREIFDSGGLPELLKLEEKLNTTLQSFVQDASVKLTWILEQEIDIPLPKARVKLVEDGYPSEVTNTGHGLQRAFVLTMLQHLALAESSVPAPTVSSGIRDSVPDHDSSKAPTAFKIPNLVLGIEEPELYQHPNRQRHLSKVLERLVLGGIAGVAEQTQVIFSTHSPLFVDLDQFDKLRVLSKVRFDQARPKVTRVRKTSLDEVAHILEVADGKNPGTYSGHSLRPRLQAIMTPWMNEGFFAKLVVLVEGEEDRAVILGMAKALDVDLDSLGVSVIPCLGKNSIDRPIAIFSALGIPTFAIWDSDFQGDNAKPEDNHRLLKLFGADVEDWPDTVCDKYGCFKRTMESRFREEIGEELYRRLLSEISDSLSFGKSENARKNSVIIRDLVLRARKEGKSSPTIERLVATILTKGNEVA